MENLGVLGGILDRALSTGILVSGPVWQRIAPRWARISDGLLGATDWRAGQRLESLRRKLDQHEEEERRRITSVIEQFSATLRAALADDEEDALFSRFEAERTRRNARSIGRTAKPGTTG